MNRFTAARLRTSPEFSNTWIFIVFVALDLQITGR